MTQKRAAVVVILFAAAAATLAVCLPQSNRVSQAFGDVRRVQQDLAAGQRFPDELAAARAEGFPTSMADLQRPPPPPSEDAAPVYARLRLLLGAHRFSPQQEAAMQMAPGQLPEASQWAQIARLLHDRTDALSLVHQAAARPQCVFRRNWATPDPSSLTFPELATVRQSARLLETESLLMAHRGQALEAVRNQALGFQVAQHAASDGTLIACLVGMAVDAITLEGLKKIMTMAGPDAAIDQEVSSVIAREYRPLSASSALRSEMAFDLGMIAHLRKQGPRGLDAAGGGSSFAPVRNIAADKWNALLDYNAVFLIRQMKKAVQAADGPYAEANPVLNQVEAQCTDPRHSARLLDAILVPILGSLAGHRARLEALRRVDLVGAAALAQSARHGQPPDHSPIPEMDPFSQKPLGYRREGKSGFVAYSAGAGGDFTGGKPGEHSWKPYQVAFRYP